MNIALANYPSADEIRLASSALSEGVYQTELYIPEMSCGSCVSKIEKKLNSLVSVDNVRANLTKKRVSVQWHDTQTPQAIISSIKSLGFTATLANESNSKIHTDLKPSLRALAVSGFAASNIMLLSVAVWSGADDATRQLFHWVSALITLPAIGYAGHVFFKSAWSAVRVGRTNMDVPISIGIILSVLLGLYDTIHHHERVYFEAATMLVFFLLIGRTLDKLMRVRASLAVGELRELEPAGAYVLQDNGSPIYKATKNLQPGETILVKIGHRIPVDGVITSGVSQIDTAIVDGESQLKDFQPGQTVCAGSLNASAELEIKITANAENSFLAQMQRLVQFAYTNKGVYTQIADKAARWYAPFVHSSAVVAFFAWFTVTGEFHKSLTVAISVLIITCPCALALAVPMVHVMAGNLFLKRGIIMKDGAALEKLGEVKTVVFDKTGTLTNDTPSLSSTSQYTDTQMRLAQQISIHSEHPYAQTLLGVKTNDNSSQDLTIDNIVHVPGFGIEASIDGKVIRLGKRSWAAYLQDDIEGLPENDESESVLAIDGVLQAEFHFHNELRLGALSAIQSLKEQTLVLSIVSGDQIAPVALVAKMLDIPDVHACASPADKVSIVLEHSKTTPVLMVGDGLNDTGAMAAAHVAMAPGTAANVGRNLADFIFLRENLLAVPEAINISRTATALIKQNIWLAVLYNVLVLPIAFAGLVSPLIAAIAMSFSSILVVANAMRLRLIVEDNVR